MIDVEQMFIVILWIFALFVWKYIVMNRKFIAPVTYVLNQDSNSKI